MDVRTPSAPEVKDIARVIKDLDLLIKALLASLPAAKPWQRQLRLHLVDAGALLQVWRMTVLMDRTDEEVVQAARALSIPMRAANAYVAAGRADAGTKQAVQLGLNLAARAVSELEAKVLQA